MGSSSPNRGEVRNSWNHHLKPRWYLILELMWSHALFCLCRCPQARIFRDRKNCRKTRVQMHLNMYVCIYIYKWEFSNLSRFPLWVLLLQPGYYSSNYTPQKFKQLGPLGNGWFGRRSFPFGKVHFQGWTWWTAWCSWFPLSFYGRSLLVPGWWVNWLETTPSEPALQVDRSGYRAKPSLFACPLIEGKWFIAIWTWWVTKTSTPLKFPQNKHGTFSNGPLEKVNHAFWKSSFLFWGCTSTSY